VRVCDAEEYGLPSMSVKSTPKFENRKAWTLDSIIDSIRKWTRISIARGKRSLAY